MPSDLREAKKDCYNILRLVTMGGHSPPWPKAERGPFGSWNPEGERRQGGKKEKSRGNLISQELWSVGEGCCHLTTLV